jgi:hypothetical protein
MVSMSIARGERREGFPKGGFIFPEGRNDIILGIRTPSEHEESL